LLRDAELEDRTCTGEVFELRFKLGIFDPSRRIGRVILKVFLV
jgi:hypothetical protein